MPSLTSLPAVADAIADAAARERRGGATRADDPAGTAARTRTIVGITGAPGAGKSTVADELVALLGPAAGLLPMDGFHLPQARLVELGRRDRMGAPDTFDVDGFIDVLRRLAAPIGNSGESVLAPGFDREVEEPVPGAIALGPEFSTVVVEGNYLLLDSGGWERAAELFDVTFFVRVPRDIRLSRLVARHERFGKSPEDALAWTLGPDESNAELIEHTAERADHTIELPVR
jgi:pantothenate kinase